MNTYTSLLIQCAVHDGCQIQYILIDHSMYRMMYISYGGKDSICSPQRILNTPKQKLDALQFSNMSTRLDWNIFGLLWPGHFIFLFPSRMVEPLNGWKYDQWYQTIILTIIFFHNSTNYSRINKNTGKCRLRTDFPGLCKMMIWCAIAVANK